MKTRNKVLLKAIKVLTLAVPVPLYLFIMVAMYKIEPDYLIHGAEFGDLSVLIEEDEYFIASDNKAAVFDGIIQYNADLDTYVLVVEQGDVIKVGDEYYKMEIEGLAELDMEKEKEESDVSNGIEVGVYIAVVLVLVIIIKKMGLSRKYPRIAVMFALVVGTGVLYGLNTIISDMLGVFYFATGSWAAYLMAHTTEFAMLSTEERARRIARAENGRS